MLKVMLMMMTMAMAKNVKIMMMKMNMRVKMKMKKSNLSASHSWSPSVAAVLSSLKNIFHRLCLYLFKDDDYDYLKVNMVRKNTGDLATALSKVFLASKRVTINLDREPSPGHCED